jgi:hypothetical protein
MLTFLLSVVLAASVPGAVAEPARQQAQQTLVIERTYLKANPQKKEALAQFIVANWFAMDRIGLDAGLFISYRLSENLDPAADWDFEVAVGYPNAEGYQSATVQARFEDIRTRHKTILIEGQSLRDLGRIVRTDRVRPREGN